MKLQLDTNIIVDIISKRAGFEGSLDVLRFCETGRAAGYVSGATVLDVMYILRKHISPESVKAAVQTLLAIVDVADVRKVDITSAFSSEMRDFEDAVQAMCAKRNKADYIVTRNVKDFVHSPVPAILPEKMLTILRGN